MYVVWGMPWSVGVRANSVFLICAFTDSALFFTGFNNPAQIVLFVITLKLL